MNVSDRITRNPRAMGGKPCIRGMRVTVGLIVGLVAEEILRAYPYLEMDDIPTALSYAARLGGRDESRPYIRRE